ncbi:hypothetical protein EON83_04650 [bacterium]|nr:MAG: hypothetical protein EON83_04650 [bacterium]
MTNNSSEINPAELSEASKSEEAPTLPHATQKKGDDNPPPLYISGFGVMGQAVPDVATGSTPVTRPDD